MKRFAVIFALAFTPLPSIAQEADIPPALNDLADSMRELLEGFTNDVAPLMEEFSEEVTPMFERLAEELKGLNAYHPPEVLPNGDIIIRRKTPKELDAPDAPKTKPGPDDPTQNEAIDI